MEAREIKFRAWDKEKKKMVYDVGVMKNKVFNFEEGAFGELLFFEELIPMQYTGLKDKKNLQEVYEGDIVSQKHFDNKKHVRVMKWSELEDCDYPVMCYGYIRFTENPEIEVIGNIYENPELLKELG